MSRAYLGGTELDESIKVLLLAAIAPTAFICKICDGAYVDLKSIFVTSSFGPIVSLYRCRNCHQMRRVREEYPPKWHNRLIGRIATSTFDSDAIFIRG